MSAVSAVSTVDDGQIELQAEPLVEVVADKCLRNQAAHVFAVGVCLIVAARLEGAEVRELLGHPGEETFATLALRFGCLVNSTKVTGHYRPRTRGKQSDEGDCHDTSSQHA